MIKILKINHNTSIGELDATLKAILTVLAKDDWTDDAYLTGLQQQLEAQYVALSAAIKRSRTVSVLKEKDQARDQALSALFNLVRGFLGVEQEVASAANKLWELLSRFGLSATRSANYANESAYINAMLTDLNADDMLAASALIPFAQEQIAKLQAAQKDFEQAYEAYTTVIIVERAQSSASAIKRDLLALLNNELVDFLRVMVKVHPDRYTALATDIAGVIDDNNERARGRRAKP